jgi:hypothetical protein
VRTKIKVILRGENIPYFTSDLRCPVCGSGHEFAKDGRGIFRDAGPGIGIASTTLRWTCTRGHDQLLVLEQD